MSRWPEITQASFERGYAERSGTTVEALRELGRSVARCDCHEEGCRGWQMAHVRELQWAVDHGIALPREIEELADARRRMP